MNKIKLTIQEAMNSTSSINLDAQKVTIILAV